LPGSISRNLEPRLGGVRGPAGDDQGAYADHCRRPRRNRSLDRSRHGRADRRFEAGHPPEERPH